MKHGVFRAVARLLCFSLAMLFIIPATIEDAVDYDPVYGMGFIGSAFIFARGLLEETAMPMRVFVGTTEAAVYLGASFAVRYVAQSGLSILNN